MSDEARIIEEKFEELEQELQDPHLLAAITEIRESFRNNRRPVTDFMFKDLDTGLYNNSYFHSRLKEEISRSQRYQRELAVLLLELATENKELFKQVGQTLPKLIRKSDILALIEPGKFSVILTETSGDDADKTAKKIITEVNRAIPFGPSETFLHGTAAFTSSRNTAEKMMSGAREALEARRRANNIL